MTASRRLSAFRPFTVAAVGLSALLVLSGCGLGSPEPSTPVSSEPSGNDLQSDIDLAIRTSQSYWKAVFESQGAQFASVEGVIPYTDPSEGDCGGEPFVLNNAFFCPVGNFIAYDQNFLAGQYQAIGDSFVYYLIGHEYAHAVQDLLGIEHRLTIQHELQADCMAGAYLGDSVRASILAVEEGDIDELLISLETVGDQPGVPWFAEGAHGTGQQRTEAFAQGYDGTTGGGSAVSACLA
ncbi:neutral zinc metallopeptidase [Kineosporia babensis]|uniref:Neutral zinc metallopeptidase n=1 Tax=Kineosporia babensis TaxID=499548 RepID=A0A9X1SVV7_9ACTN|nr:neutral zinc metallopeptidase [Kineosporia babensis]MCD5313285.1 neutral zinc metallopeptidase [Kineosporia babensis]